MEHERLFYRLVEADSTNDSPGEIEMASILFEIIKEHPYFQEHPEYCGLEDISGDSRERRYPWALYLSEQETDCTVVLTGHFDTVPTDNYDLLQKYARCPSELREQMKQKNYTGDVREDLWSDQWIFGRGTADMKGGLSALMAEFFSILENQSLPVNLLLLPVPDEEGYSTGIRASVSLMRKLKTQYHLDYQLLITSESHTRADGKILCSAGTVGKAQVNIVAAGIPAHFRNYYAGYNPVQMAAWIAAAIDGNAELCERFGNQKTLPPICMYLRDAKEHYDVTLPNYVDMAISCQIYRRSPEALLHLLQEKIEQVLSENAVSLRRQYMSWINGHTSNIQFHGKQARVILFQELLAMAQEKGGADFDRYYAQEKARALDMRRSNLLTYNGATLKLVHAVLNYVSENVPLVVIALTPPLYPSFTNSQIVPPDHPALRIPEKLGTFSREEFGVETRMEEYFSGISDMSYAATTYTTAETDSIAGNMPIWGEDYQIDFDAIRELQIPVLNIGPWGKDIHTGLERVNKKSLFIENRKMIRYVLETISGERNDIL